MTSKRGKQSGWGPAAGMRTRWQLTLYVAGAMGRSVVALANLKELCLERLAGECEVKVVDLTQEPARAGSDGVLVVPTLERTAPKPVRRVVGDLSNAERVLAGLDLKTS